MTLRSRTPLNARDPLPIPDRYRAQFDDPDDPDEVTIFDEAVDGAGALTTWITSDAWLDAEVVR